MKTFLKRNGLGQTHRFYSTANFKFSPAVRSRSHKARSQSQQQTRSITPARYVIMVITWPIGSSALATHELAARILDHTGERG